VDVETGIHARNKVPRVTIYADEETIREPRTAARNVERIEPLDPPAEAGDGRESISVASSGAPISRAGDELGTRIRVAERVVVVAFALAALGACNTTESAFGAFDVSGGRGWIFFWGTRLIVRFWGVDDGDPGTALLKGSGQDEASEGGEWEKDTRETHGAVEWCLRIQSIGADPPQPPL